MGLKETYFSPAVGIMGFWRDMNGLLAPHTAPVVLNEGLKTKLRRKKKWRRLVDRVRRTTSDPRAREGRRISQ